MNIYDCFMYFDEDMLLDLRLNILDKYVKKFIISESTYLHNGSSKKLNFNINKFAHFKKKIEYIIVKEPPKNIEDINSQDSIDIKNFKIQNNALKRENYQRNMLAEGLIDAKNEDIIIISDLDEIPNLSNFVFQNKLNFFNQKIFYYKFNLKHPDLNWVGSRACKKKDLISPQWLRNIKGKKYQMWRLDTCFSKKKYSNINFINNGGWHFTNIKSPKDIHFKLSNFMHHLEFKNSKLGVNEMEQMIIKKKVLYDHKTDKKTNKWNADISLVKTKDDELPEFLIRNRNKYKTWFD